MTWYQKHFISEKLSFCSINLEVLLLYIKNLIKFINIKFKFKYLIITFYWDVHTPYLKTLGIFKMSFLFVSFGLYKNAYCISCVVINCINLSNKSFDLIPQTFYFWKIKFLFFRPWGIFISRFSCLPVLLIVVVRVSRRGKAHMRFLVSRLKRIFTIAYVNISMFFFLST
jgi:hypothetical protein